MPKLYFSTPWLSIGFFFALTLLVNQAHARVGSSPLSWTEQHIPKQRRSLKELSNQVFQELLEVHRSSGMMGPVLIPSTAVRVHRILVEGSADQGQEFDEEAQKRALLALRLGADNLIKDLKEEDADYRRFLEQDSNLRAGHMDHRALISSGTLGLILFGTLVVTLIVLAVTNIIAGATGTNIPIVGSDPRFVTGTPGLSYEAITPCNRLPLIDDINYSYLPITNGLVSTYASGTIGKSPTETFEILAYLMDPERIPEFLSSSNGADQDACFEYGDDCSLTAECCENGRRVTPAPSPEPSTTPAPSTFLVEPSSSPSSKPTSSPSIGGEYKVTCNETAQCDRLDLNLAEVPNGFTIEPFCLLWSTENGFMDTIGFTPRSPWPPIDLLPQPSFLAKGLPAKLALWSRNRVLPSCQSPSYPGCFYCEFVNGFEMGPPIEIGKIGYQATMKFGGFALSWADQGKLAYGTNSATGSGDAPQIWDGFRNQDLPVIEGMNFWLSFELNFLSSFAHDYAKLECSATKYPVKPSFLEKKAILKMKFELYVAFDRSITVADGQGFAQDLTKNLAGEYVTSEPTSSPSMAPSETPSSSPSVVPSHQPTSSPSSSIGPSGEPTGAPSGSITPSHQPTSSPSSSIGPSGEPTGAPSRSVSESPSEEPSPGSTESAERQRKLMFGDDDYNTNNMWRKLSESTSDPCVILSVTELSVGLPAIGKLNFGNALGGWCTFPPQVGANNQLTRCTPSGFFLNVNQQFELQDGFLGILGKFLEGPREDAGFPDLAAGNSLGVFQDENGDIEATVFRLEFPILSFFGVTLPGLGRPIIHFQHLKGSEVERRRETILRRRVRVGGTWGPWILNCLETLGTQECNNNDESHWEDFGEQLSNLETQICTNILLNPDQDPDKLLYYNRVLTAEPSNIKEKYKKIPKRGSHYQVPARYDFSNDPNADIFILYFAIANINLFVIAIKEISVALIISDSPSSTVTTFENPTQDQEVAIAAYNALNETLKGLWQPPNPAYFNLQEYLDYIPQGYPATEEELDGIDNYQQLVDNALEEQKFVYIRLLCKISFMFFVDIDIGFVMENWQDDEPNRWLLVGQLAIEFAGLLYDCVVRTELDFDRRQHRHLEGEEYHRALTSAGLNGANFDIKCSTSCVACNEVTEFFIDLGEAMYNGMQDIGRRAGNQIVNIANELDCSSRYMKSVCDFGGGVAQDVADAFENGSTAQLLTSERGRTFTEDVETAVQGFYDGQISPGDLVNIGQLLNNGATWETAGALAVAAFTDLENAANKVFGTLADAFSDFFDCGVCCKDPRTEERPWKDIAKITRFRTGISFASGGFEFVTIDTHIACHEALESGNKDAIMSTCWLTDAFGCPVKIREVRTCISEPKPVNIVDCRWTCSEWEKVPVSQVIDGETRYPRFDNAFGFRKEYKRCQERALREMGEAASANVRMTQLASLVDDSYNSNLKGLMDNFSPAAMRLRRLTGGADGPADVDEITFSEFNVTDGVGGLRSAAVAIGSYTGNQLQADTASTATVTSDISATFDFSSFDNPSSRRLNPLNPLDGSFVARRAHRAAAVPFLAGLNRPSDEFLQVAPTSLTPEIALGLGSPGGTSENPFMLDCDGPLANTWEEYLDDNEEDETTGAFQRTSLEQQAEVIVREKIICGQIPISVTLVNNPGFTNVFEDVYELLGNSQAISLIQPNSRRLVSAPIADFSSVTVRAISAEAFCSYFEWEFQVYATDGTTNTNTISVFARLQYDDTELDLPISMVQTVCTSDNITVEALEEDINLKELTLGNPTSFKPDIKGSCRSPFHYLTWSDQIVNPGTPCSTDYERIQRDWVVQAEGACPSPSPMLTFTQTFILGGLNLGNGMPASPLFVLQDVTYNLPDVQSAAVSTNVSDLLHGEPTSECGLCSIPEEAIVYSHPHDFNCSEVGDNNQVSVMVKNSIGISVTKYATVNVTDTSPPHIVSLDGSVDEDVVLESTLANVNTWDNCEVAAYEIVSGPNNGIVDDQNLPMFSFTPNENYFGTDALSFRAIDPRGLPSQDAVFSIQINAVNDGPRIWVSPESLPSPVLLLDGTALADTIIVQYSDTISPINVSAEDLDDTSLALSVKGLPKGLQAEVVGDGCSSTKTSSIGTVFPNGASCKWVLSGVIDAPAGIYDINFTVSDTGGFQNKTLHDSMIIRVEVEPEDVSIGFDSDNGVAFRVTEDGGVSGEFSLLVHIRETVPEDNQGLPGNLHLAHVHAQVAPVGPGGSHSGNCKLVETVTDADSYMTNSFSCTFNLIPVNTYTVEITVDGGHYSGYGEDVVTIFDPSLGFTTGGGWFYWPGTTEKTNFGYTMKYRKNGRGVQGNLLLIRHVTDDTKYRVKSNALEGLAVGGMGEDVGWASFSGKCTYLDKDWEDPVGNHYFVTYVADYAPYEAGEKKNQSTQTEHPPSRFWFETRDKDNVVIADLSMLESAVEHAIPIGGGNLVVPH